MFDAIEKKNSERNRPSNQLLDPMRRKCARLPKEACHGLLNLLTKFGEQIGRLPKLNEIQSRLKLATLGFAIFPSIPAVQTRDCARCKGPLHPLGQREYGLVRKLENCRHPQERTKSK